MEANQPTNDGNFIITGDWATQAKQLKEKFTTLTDADLEFENGKEGELLGRLEIKLDKKRNEVISIINEGQPKIA